MNPVQTSELKTKRKSTGFRLFKRDDAGRELPPAAAGWKERPYYFRFQYRKQSFIRCLETNDATQAQSYARKKFKEITEALVRDNYTQLEATKLKSTTCAMVEDLLKVYRACGVDAGAKTRVQNEYALLQTLRILYPAGADPERTPITAINANLTSAWFKAGSAKALAAPDQTAAASIKRSTNSRFVQAKSLFVPKALAAYKTAGCYHACLEEFAAAGDVHKFSRVARIEYNPPSEHIVTATLDAWEKLDTSTPAGRNLFLAIGHELAFGLRAHELAQARWSCWTTRQGYPVLDGACEVKNGSGVLQVRALDPWFSILRDRIEAKHWRDHARPEDFILAGTKTDRVDVTFRLVSDFMRSSAHSWDTQKTNHALRAFAGSQVAMKYGIYEAQCWLRHSTVKVTEQHYSHFIKRFRPADPDSLPARWATDAKPAQPALRILEAPAAAARN